MAVQIIDATGSHTGGATYGLVVNSDGSINTVISDNVLVSIGSQASIFVILCGISGTSTIPLRCTSTGYLMTSGGES